MEDVTIAIACELAPAKTFIPIIKKLKELEIEGKLNWENSKIIALTHGSGASKLIKPYCDEMYSIGESRSAGKLKTNIIKLGFLIARDSIKALFALSGKKVDLLITCGNAGDVRKSIIAAKFLKIPVIHIEQDIYNPIETIAYSNLITVPEESYKDFLGKAYLMDINSIKNIQGYPMVSYVKDYLNNENLISQEEIKKEYGFSEFILVVLGGDLKTDDLKSLIKNLENISFPILIAPYRFKKELIEKLTKSSEIKVLNEYVDLISLMRTAKLMIYGAGIGITIEAGVLEVPSIKIAGFHKEHGSIDLANMLNIPILEINQIPGYLNDFNNNLNINKPNGKKLIEDSQLSVEKIVEIITHFNLDSPKSNGFKSMKAIWNQRSKYRLK